MTGNVGTQGNQHLDRLMRAIASVLCASGFTDKEAIDTLRLHLANSTLSPRGPVAEGATYSQLNRFLANLLTTWHTLPDYVDESGEPLELAFDGKPPSLCSLIDDSLSRFTGDSESWERSYILDFLVEYRAVTSVGESKYVPTRREFLVVPKDAENMRFVVEMLAEFAETMLNNVADPDNSLLQRVARVQNIPADRLRTIRAFLDDGAIGFLESADAKLCSQLSNGSADENKVDVAVGVYLSVRDSGEGK